MDIDRLINDALNPTKGKTVRNPATFPITIAGINFFNVMGKYLMGLYQRYNLILLIAYSR